MNRLDPLRMIVWLPLFAWVAVCVLGIVVLAANVLAGLLP